MSTLRTLVLRDVAEVIDCEHKTAPRAPVEEAYALSVGTGSIRNGRIDLSGAKPVTLATYRDWTRRAVPRAGDIILAREAPIGEAALVPEATPICLGQRTVLIQPSEHLIVPRYLHYFLLSSNAQRWFRHRATGSTVLHVNVADVRNTPFGRLPSLSEQRRLVDILEDHLSRLDAAESSATTATHRLAALEASALSRCRAGRERRLDEVAAIQGGLQKHHKREPKHNAYPFLRVANITKYGLDLKDVHEIELFDGELDKLRLRVGDLLVVEGNGSPSQIGRAATWNGSIDDCVHQNHLIRVRPSPQLNPAYLEAVWNSPQNRKNLTRLASSSSGLHTLSVSKLKTLSIPVPSLSRQTELMEALAVVRGRRNRLEAELRIVRAKGKRLRHALLDAAFSGRLTGRASDIEIVEEMTSV
ncbi:MAG TPA: restriction endonuclease subunit S [Micromonosporaceae bacterium]|nr:restriction endonuclease subunit S [Micromonosporaceae bacterium]